MNNYSAVTRMFRTAMVLGVGLVPLSSSAAQFSINVDTSSLSTTTSIAFDFIDGDATQNNIVALSNFNFGGGAALGVPAYNCTSGSGASCTGVTGSLLSSVLLYNNTDFFNEVVADFMPGTSLSFTLFSTSNFAGGTPDSFLMYLLDGSGNPIGTTEDPFGTDSFLSVEILPAAVLGVYGSATPCQAGSPCIPAPTVTSISEPDTLPVSLMGLGILAYVLRSRRFGETPIRS